MRIVCRDINIGSNKTILANGGVYVDTITCVKEVAESMEKVMYLPGGAYNFGSETTKSMYEITKEFLRMLGKNIEVEDSPSRHNLWMNCEKDRKYGVEFSSVLDGLEKCAKDYSLI